MVTYIGVYETDTGHYEARIFKEGRETRIGVYDSSIEAALAYDLTVEAMLGEFAINFNFPERPVAEFDNN
jgi:hypothetical protein